MENLKMYCLSINSSHLNVIKGLNYIPVGLGNENFSKEWFKDNTGENISHKNRYYGEYTFHYWLWKNYLDKVEDGWIGFCQYRKFWTTLNKNETPKTLDELKSSVLRKIPKEYENFDSILGEPMVINQLKIMKFIKRGFKMVLKNPSYLFDKNKRNIKFHFDMWHGNDYLSKAIELLDKENREDFNNFVDNKNSFNPHNMFICKSKKILNSYYEIIFPWLKRCEEIFGHKNLSGYGQTRIYGFLAERFMSYWFQKNTKFKTMPIIFYDIRKNLNQKPL